MDKYYGISKATKTSHNISYETLAVSAKLPLDADSFTEAEKIGRGTINSAKSGKNAVFFARGRWVRYAACGIILAVCALGTLGGIAPFKTAADFIKTELNRDISQEFFGEKD